MVPGLGRGVFVTLEGGDGCGKSTQARALAQMLGDEGYEFVLTQEPAGTDLGRAIKDIFAGIAARQRATPVEPMAELLLFEAARAQHVQDVIRPALAERKVVLCDRFADSTLAYQGYGRGLDLDQVRACSQMATGGLTPDLTLLLDLPPEVGLRRADTEVPGASCQKVRDSIGQESLEFHRRVREGFLALARSEPHRIIVLDGALAPAVLTRAAWERLREFLRAAQ